MKIFLRNIFSTLFIIAFLMNLYSCREEIIAPNNPAGNINEPVTLTSQGSYTFLINANNITSDLVDFPFINSTITNVFLSIIDHGSGSVNVGIFDSDTNVLYENRFGRNFSSFNVKLEGRNPYKLELNFTNFSGKFKIQLTRQR